MSLSAPALWPELDVARDQPTFATLHLVSQLLGKLRVAHAPWVNHGWHVTLRPRADGLAILPIKADDVGFDLMLDLCRHQIVLTVSDGRRESLALRPASISELHGELVAMLDRHRLPSSFNGRPSEIAGALPFAEDHAQRGYNPASAERLRDALALIVPIFEHFRAGFRGKASPVHFFWGAFHEVSNAGFWAGGVVPAEPLFYSYAYPEPLHFREADIVPAAARFDPDLGEYVLPYAAVRAAADPAATLMEFLQATYALAADLGHWDRAALERDPVAP